MSNDLGTINLSYGSNRMRLPGDGLAPPVVAVPPPNPGQASKFQRAWEEHRNHTGAAAQSFPLTLDLADVLEGYAVLLRNLPDLDTTARQRAAMGAVDDDFDGDYVDYNGFDDDGAEDAP